MMFTSRPYWRLGAVCRDHVFHGRERPFFAQHASVGQDSAGGPLSRMSFFYTYVFFFVSYMFLFLLLVFLRLDSARSS